jgi:hypothetical protein
MMPLTHFGNRAFKGHVGSLFKVGRSLFAKKDQEHVFMTIIIIK